MRDIGLLLILGIALPVAVFRPWLGALVWVWVSTMSPHRMTYGFMYDAPVAQSVALATMVGLLVSREPKRLPLAAPVVWMLLFTGWMVITYPFSLVPTSENLDQLVKVLKIMLLNVIVLLPLYTRRHANLLIATLAVSIAFFGAKGGVFAILTGGQYQVRGGGGFIEPNNELALALVMTIPLLVYLVQQSTRRSIRWLLSLGIFLCAVAAIASQSRGALVAILAMAATILARSNARIRLLFPILAMGMFIAAFMPEQWWDRMQTMQTYQQDASAMGRINAWTVAWRVASDNFFGGGFVIEHPMIFDRYAPNPEFIAVAHSVYFQVLGQHGFVGLFLYLCIWIATFRTCWWVYRNTDDPGDRQLARMAEVSLVGFFVGGAFLSLAYFDGPYYIMIALVVLRYKVLGNRRRSVGVEGAASPRTGPQT
jgi:putative inorganic carbon (hco3(-)) transporter